MPSERKKMQKVKKSDEDASLFLIYLGGDYSVSTVYDIIAHHALSVALFDNRLSHYWHRASSLDRFSLY